MALPRFACPCCGGAFDGFFAASGKSAEGLGRFDPVLDRRTFLAAATAATRLAAARPTRVAAQEPQATVFTGGTILTVDAAFSETEALAIRGNRIIAVGSAEEVRAAAGAGAIEVDPAGRAMLLGFIDPHTHVVSGAAVDSITANVGMARFSSAAEVFDHLRARVAAAPPGEWALGRNVDPALQEGPDALTFAELDAISTEVPIFLLNASGHLAHANRKAFQAAGIPDDVVDPPGGEYVRDADGRLTGVIKYNVAFVPLVSAAPAIARLDPVEALITLLDKWSGVGLTTVSELALGTLTRSVQDAQIMFAAAQSGRLKARIRAYTFYTVGSTAWDEAGIGPGNCDAMARIAGHKLVADGSNQGFTSFQREPYLNSDSRGAPYMTPEEMTATALDRASRGWQLALHGNGDAGIDMVLDACTAVRDAGMDMGTVRARIGHCSMLHDDQITRMKDLGVSASFLIGHVHCWGVLMRDRVFGPERVMHPGRLRSVEEAGVGFTLHSDFMVTEPDPLQMIQMR